jgi:hypothetical protein
MLTQVLKYKPENYVMNELRDLFPSLLYFPIVLLINKFFVTVFSPIIRKNLSLSVLEDQSNDNAEIYVKKACTSMFKFLFYLLSTILGYYTLKDTEYLTTNFFGKGRYENIYKNPYPYNFFWEKPEGLAFYININLTFCFFDIFELLVNPFQSDFLFMLMHHLSTIALIVYSTITNCSNVGGSVIFLHFYGDIFSYIVRSILYLNVGNWLRGLTTFAFLVNFAYSRIYVFITWLIIIKNGLDAQIGDLKTQWFLFERWLYNFLCVLLLLHFIWTFMIGKKFIQYLLTGRVIDIVKVKKKAILYFRPY